MPENGPFLDKLNGLARVALGAKDVVLTDQASKDLAAIEAMQLAHLPLCLAKTHLSISDDEKVKGRPPPFTLTVTGVRASAGAGFLVVLCGPILTMPGLPEVPAAARIDIEKGADGSWHVRGLH
jgi:formate--tetrahydrofolate ligase